MVKYTLQQIFDKVIFSLRAQGDKFSYDPEIDLILYRGPDGTRDAIGHLIDDEHYSPELEGLTVPVPFDPDWRQSDWPDLSKDGMVGEALIASGIHPEQFGFLEELQNIHDVAPREIWEREWKSLAKDFDLVYKDPEDIDRDELEGPSSWKP